MATERAQDRIRATYHIETSLPVGEAAEALAREQSTGTFVRVPGETEALRQRFAARVESITELEGVDCPSLPGARRAKEKYSRARVVISFPLENVGLSLPNLLTTVAGNLYELAELSGVRLLDIEIPDAFMGAYPGPQFGIDGTRQLTGVYERPIVGTIVKPSVGFSPRETAALVEVLAQAGLDFTKDDELIANPPYSPLAERVKEVMPVINRAADRTGKKMMFAFNITGDVDDMLRHHDTVLDAGGTCVMVSLLSVGLAGLAHLRRHCQLPIHGHRNGWGALTRDPYLGMAFRAYQKLWRLAGVDHLHTNGLRNKFAEPDDSVIASVKSCLSPLFSGYRVMPVLSSGQWAGQVPDTYERLASVDLMYLCGGGIMGHPEGVAAGVASVRQAWEAALLGKSLEDYAHQHVELRLALATFGR